MLTINYRSFIQSGSLKETRDEEASRPDARNGIEHRDFHLIKGLDC